MTVYEPGGGFEWYFTPRIRKIGPDEIMSGDVVRIRGHGPAFVHRCLCMGPWWAVEYWNGDEIMVSSFQDGATVCLELDYIPYT